MSKNTPDFIHYSLEKLTPQQWEELCDHCGKCCLLKLEDMDNGRVYLTDVVCKEYNMQKQACSCYNKRLEKVQNCVKVTLEDTEIFSDLPMSCAYRLRFENKPLLKWHPLISGSNNSVSVAGISIKDKIFSEEFIHPDEFARHIIEEIV